MQAMELLNFLIDFVLHVDQHLEIFVHDYGTWVYALLFVVVFVETGLVVMPFLPGDSLLFVVGAMAGAGLLQFAWVLIGLWLAASLGDQCNYAIGRWLGPRVFQWENSRFFNRQAFERAHAFYERYGGVTIVLARFMPFLRTFVPFVAGVAQMNRASFTFYNTVGAAAWVLGVCTAGYFLGSLPWVKSHLELIIWGLILIPGLLVLWGSYKARRRSKEATQ
jgi:membrane-associated protein